LLGLGGGHHAGGEGTLEFGVAALEEQPGIADGVRVEFRGGKAFDAWAEAAVYVVLEAGTRMVAGEIDLATGDEEAAMDELDDAIG
jgi:hypothetical protein